MFTLRTDCPPLDAIVVQPKLEELLEASANLLERNWPQKYSTVDQARILFYTRMRLLRNTYDSLMWIAADCPKDSRRKMLVLSSAPLVRSLFEELISIIFILQDVRNLVPALVMTGYTEVWRERQHAKKYYGDQENWDDYISKLDARLDDLSSKLGLSEKQKSRPASTWPTPGKILQAMKKSFPSSSALSFVEFLNSSMYRTLSAESHLSYEALIRRGGLFATKELKPYFGEEKFKRLYKQNYESYRMEMIWTTFTLLLAVVSEIEGHFGFGLADRAKYLWVIFEQSSNLAKEFWVRRYSKML